MVLVLIYKVSLLPNEETTTVWIAWYVLLKYIWPSNTTELTANLGWKLVLVGLNKALQWEL